MLRTFTRYFTAVTACSRVSRMNRVYGIPRAFARAFTAASNGFGTRMLICSSFFSNSNRAALNCEKSRLDRSWARNASACRSVLSRGTFFFIGCNLLGVHVASGHRADEAAAVFRPYGEGHEHGPPCAGSSHCNQAVFVRRVLWVGCDARIVREQRLNLRKRNTMLAALRPVAIIPIEAIDLKVHHSTILDKCIYIFVLPSFLILGCISRCTPGPRRERGVQVSSAFAGTRNAGKGRGRVGGPQEECVRGR